MGGKGKVLPKGLTRGFGPQQIEPEGRQEDPIEQLTVARRIFLDLAVRSPGGGLNCQKNVLAKTTSFLQN